MLFLGATSAFGASLLVVHALGPLLLALAAPWGGLPDSALWDPLAIGLALAIVGPLLAFVLARTVELPVTLAGRGVGFVGTAGIWSLTALPLGVEALWQANWSFPLRLGLAYLALRLARAAAFWGLPQEARNPYAALMDETRPRVVIVGGGFGGLAAARALARAEVRVTLIDARNHHLFQPLLYQVATAALPPSSIASPLRRILRGQVNAEVLMARVVGVDLERRQLLLEAGGRNDVAGGEGRLNSDAPPSPGGVLGYDRLVLAAGSSDSYFGHDEWRHAAPGLKTVGQAMEIRNRMLRAFEEAERASDPEKRRALLTFVVVGGGPTGVEMAGAFSEIARQTLSRDFRHIQPASARVVLIEAAPRLLGSFDARLAEVAARALGHLGVELLFHCPVSHIDERGVAFKTEGGERRIECRTLVWAAGQRANPLGQTLGVPLDRSGRVVVGPDLSVAGYPEVQVIGDLAAAQSDGKQVPGLAPAAMQQGRHAARNILRNIQNKPPEPFRYRDKGSLATIGRWKAVGQVGKLRFSGLLAWLAWGFIHILYLIGFRNRYLVFIEWAFSYFNHDRGARLIAEASDANPLGDAFPLEAPLLPPHLDGTRASSEQRLS